jgi:hypothetical protein
MALMITSPIASAKPGYVTFPAERVSQVAVKGTQGFRITIVRAHGRVQLTANKGKTSAIYIVRSAKAPADRIAARFPGLGRISLRFHPTGEPMYPAPFCRGRPPIKQVGIFRGMIRFNGERGFTRAVASRARGYMYRSFKEVCRGAEGGLFNEPIPGYSLTAKARSHGGGVLFSAFRSTEDSMTQGETYYSALMSEKRSGMSVVRTVFVRAGPSTFVVEGPSTTPELTTVAPPAPFTGDASFRWVSGMSTEWSGSLLVELPGAGTVPLTGGAFESKFCLNKHCLGRLRVSASDASSSGEARLSWRDPSSRGVGRSAG